MANHVDEANTKYGLQYPSAKLKTGVANEEGQCEASSEEAKCVSVLSADLSVISSMKWQRSVILNCRYPVKASSEDSRAEKNLFVRETCRLKKPEAA
jgi:hypothetical protein